MKKSGKDNKSGSQSLHNRSSGNHGASGADPMSLLDPVSLFGKFWSSLFFNGMLQRHHTQVSTNCV